ncbi:MAG TPA: MBL fold metallo-hydrolase, partial [Candidatus Omnitrophota bacterium]|nr:MBL fold metallo-hydrolase [Candidatus Omnitrophota bacterium]
MDNNNSGNCIIERFVVGPMGVNCYLVADPDTGEACLIDPGADPDAMKNYIKEKGLDLKFIIITHGHGDHIAANGYFNVPIYIHKD